MNWNIKLDLKQIIYLVISGIILAWLIISQVRCNKLQKELNKEKINNLELVDSLTYINKIHLKNIEKLNSEISDLKYSIDSLEQIKNKIVYKKDGVIVSKDVSSGVEQLKHNLQKWSD